MKEDFFDITCEVCKLRSTGTVHLSMCIRGMNSFENLKKKNTFPQLFLLSTNLALEKARKDTVFLKLFQRPPSKPLIIKVQEKNLPQLTLVKSSSGRRGW